MPNALPPDANPITLFAQTTFRNQQRRFGIKLDDRRRHVYVLGKTGMGKTTMLENMILSDVYAGHGCAYIDPHGDTAEKILDYIPSWRINDVVYFNPADLNFPVGFNILETTNDEQKHLVASGLMSVFKKIWPDVWSPRMEYILLNCVLALLDYPGATLLGINRLLVDREYRQRVIDKIRNPIVKTFWVAEFSSWSEKYATEAIAPVQNKVGQFLSASIIRNIIAQVKSTIDPRQIMDDGKIFIVNLSKGRIGEDNMKLLGGMLIEKIQLAAMGRVDIPEESRRDFFLYVDEFQNFATPSFANILSEARKYRLSLIMAHQYIEQLDETVRDAVFGNVGTIITFRVGAPDATFMETEFTPMFLPEDITNLPKFNIYLKLMVDGVSTEPFSAATLPPIAQRTDSAEKVIQVSRERYATPRQDIEEKVLRWSGMSTGTSSESPEPTALNLVMGGEVSYPKIETAEEKETAESSDDRASGEYLTFSTDRLAAITKAQPNKKKDKPKFKHTCSRCGKDWEMPVQLDPSRPMYCSDCLPLVREDRKLKGSVMKAAVTGSKNDGLDLTEGETVETTEEAQDPLHQAMKAVEEGRPIPVERRAKSAPAPEPNRPRLVVTDQEKYATVTQEPEDMDDSSELIKAIEDQRGAPVGTRKQDAVPRKDPPRSQQAPAAPRDRPRDDSRDRDRKRRRRDDRSRSGPREPSSVRIENRFKDIERKFDEEKAPIAKKDDDPSRTVFKKQDSPSPARPVATGAVQGSGGQDQVHAIKPGQRIRFT